MIYVVVDRPNVAVQDDAKHATRIVRSILTEVLPYMGIFMTEELSEEERAELEALQIEIRTPAVQEDAEEEGGETTGETTGETEENAPDQEEEQQEQRAEPWKEFPIDPQTGYAIDPSTGAYVDPDTGAVLGGSFDLGASEETAASQDAGEGDGGQTAENGEEDTGEGGQ